MLDQCETLQGDGNLFTTNQESNLTVHKMSTNHKAFLKSHPPSISCGF